MKRVVRLNVFETASSSVHSIVICDKETYNKWSTGELVYLDEKDKNGFGIFEVPDYKKYREEVIEYILRLDRKYKAEEEIPENLIREYISEWKPTLDEWCEDEYLETSIDSIKINDKEYCILSKYGFSG